jgi:hypothetical protein
VVSCFYGLARMTGDLDYWTAVPANFNLLEVTGEGSPLHKKYRVCLHKAAARLPPRSADVLRRSRPRRRTIRKRAASRTVQLRSASDVYACSGDVASCCSRLLR